MIDVESLKQLELEVSTEIFEDLKKHKRTIVNNLLVELIGIKLDTWGHVDIKNSNGELINTFRESYKDETNKFKEYFIKAILDRSKWKLPYSNTQLQTIADGLVYGIIKELQAEILAELKDELKSKFKNQIREHLINNHEELREFYLGKV
jgi:hypothetical protein